MALVAGVVVVAALLCPSIDSNRNNQPEDNFADINNCTLTHSPKEKIQLYLSISIYYVYPNIVKL